MSQLFELTVTFRELSEPASMMNADDVVVIPNAARAEDVKANVAKKMLWRNILKE